MIIKSALAKESLEKNTCIVIALNLNGLFPINKKFKKDEKKQITIKRSFLKDFQ